MVVGDGEQMDRRMLNAINAVLKDEDGADATRSGKTFSYSGISVVMDGDEVREW